MNTPQIVVLSVLGTFVLWMVLAACAYAHMDEHSNGAFKRWYKERPPYAIVTIAFWLSWPYLLYCFLQGRKLEKRSKADENI